MSLDFSEYLNVLDEDQFDETPVLIEEFVSDYLGLPPLSDIQYQIIRASTQIYKRETLHSLYGDRDGEKRWKQTCNEIVLCLGKGSGKDYMATIAIAYIVYLLLCLKDPQRYYGKPPGDNIDIINIAVNAEQAKNVFFDGFTKRIENSAWFEGKYDKRIGTFEFDKHVRVFSGHSEREAWEGYNVIAAVLDEISGFAMETGHGDSQKTAEAIYEMYSGSVTSRFPDFGKVILLSFPRHKGDFIMKAYADVINDKETLIKKKKLKIHSDLPDNTEGNTIEIVWEEDHIVSYNQPRVFALRRPSWDVNPTKKIEDYIPRFIKNLPDAMGRFACMPPDTIDAFFKDQYKLETAFSSINGLDNETGVFYDWFGPRPDRQYFVHVDLSKKHDHCAVALTHVDSWTTSNFMGKASELRPVVKVDAIRWWTPTKDKSINFADVRDYILMLRNLDFDIKLVTFDRWRSDDLIEELGAAGMKAEVLSVAKRHYDDFKLVIYDSRIIGPGIELLLKELKSLRITNANRVDHPSGGSKDLADATCGAVYNAISRTPRQTSDVIEVRTREFYKEPPKEQSPGVIHAPPGTEMPDILKSFVSKMGVL